MSVDNGRGPAGGGSGHQAIAITVTLSLPRLLEPTIGGVVSLEVVDEGAIITLDA